MKPIYLNPILLLISLILAILAFVPSARGTELFPYSLEDRIENLTAIAHDSIDLQKIKCTGTPFVSAGKPILIEGAHGEQTARYLIQYRVISPCGEEFWRVQSFTLRHRAIAASKNKRH